MEYKIPEGVTIEIGEGALKVTAGGHVTQVKFNGRLMKAERRDGKLEISARGRENRGKRAAMISLTKHVDNIAAGLKAPFEKKLQVVYAHFPISIEVRGGDALVKNFLGEKVPRKAKIVGGAQVKASGQEITVSGGNKEEVGQTAANLVNATRIVDKDRRVFQDGIYYSE